MEKWNDGRRYHSLCNLMYSHSSLCDFILNYKDNDNCRNS